MKGAIETYDQKMKMKSNTTKSKVEDVNDAEVEYKKDYQVGEGATYTG
jgi:hypothetical protein